MSSNVAYWAAVEEVRRYSWHASAQSNFHAPPDRQIHHNHTITCEMVCFLYGTEALVKVCLLLEHMPMRVCPCPRWDRVSPLPLLPGHGYF